MFSGWQRFVFVIYQRRCLRQVKIVPLPVNSVHIVTWTQAEKNSLFFIDSVGKTGHFCCGLIF